jgi:restriction system protein
MSTVGDFDGGLRYGRPMPRTSKRQARSEQRRAEAAVKLLALGGAFIIAPLFFGKAFASLIPIGLMMMAAGGVFVWMGRQGSSSASDLQAPHRGNPRPWNTDRPPPPVDRTPTELERIEPSFDTARQAPSNWGPEVFNVIEWRRFEALVEALFQQAGFETKAQSHGADEGIDVWLYSRSHPEAPVSIVQCKHWSGKRVGVDKIRELRGVMASKDINRGQFATTSTFTPDAVTFARDNGINLLDVDGLLGLIAKRTSEQQDALLAIAMEGEYWRPTCVNCGVKMVDRTPKKGGNGFWGCANYPRCKTTMAMRMRPH